MEKNQIHISIEAEFHMLRHFERFSEASLNRIKTAFTQAQIDAEMTQAGSRFYHSFANDIDSILDHVFASNFQQKTGSNGNKILSVLSEVNVGDNSVVSIDTLTQIQKEKITLQSNRGLQLMHLEVDQLPPTNTFVLILKPEGDVFHFITAFPGDEGLPLPYDTLPEDFLQECKVYWDKHVFLDKKQEL